MQHIYTRMQSSKTKKAHAVKNQAVLNCFEASDERLTQFLQQLCEKLAVDYMLDYYLRSTYELQKDIQHLKESEEQGVAPTMVAELLKGKIPRLKRYHRKAQSHLERSKLLEKALFADTNAIDADRTYQYAVDLPDESAFDVLAHARKEERDENKRSSKRSTKPLPGCSRGGRKSTAMPEKNQYEAFYQQRAISKKENVGLMVAAIAKGEPISDSLFEKTILSTRFVFLARKIHLHKIIWKLAKIRVKEKAAEEEWEGENEVKI